MLVHFPIALWTVGAGADACALFAPSPACIEVAFAGQLSGAVMALPAMLTGVAEYTRIPREHAARSMAVTHLLAMTTAWSMFVVSLALRGLPETGTASMAGALVAFAAWAVMAAGGWYGGQLVYRFGVGVSARAPLTKPCTRPPAS
jgi:uncharacterized membrane protein